MLPRRVKAVRAGNVPRHAGAHDPTPPTVLRDSKCIEIYSTTNASRATDRPTERTGHTQSSPFREQRRFLSFPFLVIYPVILRLRVLFFFYSLILRKKRTNQERKLRERQSVRQQKWFRRSLNVFTKWGKAIYVRRKVVFGDIKGPQRTRQAHHTRYRPVRSGPHRPVTVL